MQYASLDAVAPMLPERAPSPRARLDMINWYVDSMTQFGTFWAATVRKHFPDTPIYQSLGGTGEPIYGSRFLRPDPGTGPLWRTGSRDERGEQLHCEFLPDV